MSLYRPLLTRSYVVQELQYFVTADCSSVLRCYGFWHWVYLVVTAAGICGLMWGYGRYQIPISLKGSFGLPHFEVCN